MSPDAPIWPDAGPLVYIRAGTSPARLMRTVLVYRDRLLPRSEHGFMRRQYRGFTRLAPVWVGSRTEPALERVGIAPPIILGRTGPLGALDRTAFKQLGIVPPTPDLARLAPALVHAQFGRGGALALPLARRLGVPLAVTFHGGDAHKDKHYRRSLIQGVYARRLPALLREASLFVCVSHSVREKLLARGFPESKLVVIPIGAELPETPARPEDGKHLLFVGRFVEKKGISVLLDAMRRLRAAGDPAKLLMLGDGPLLDQARSQAEAIGNIALPGWQTQAQVEAAMRGAFALIVPSVVGRGGDAEGLPSVAVEAMTLGLPVIASKEAGLNEALSDGAAGMIVPAGDAASLAEAMQALLADRPLLARLGQGARALAQRCYDARTQSALLETALLSLL